MAVTDSTDAPPPAYDVTADASSSPIALTLTADPSGKEVLITVTPPTAPVGESDEKKGDVKAKRAPVDFVLTIDVSGSMGASAPVPGDNESTGLSVLDVVKHAAKTIVVTMKPEDRVAIVTFSSDAKTLLPLTHTTDDGKKNALALLESLPLEGNTNLWDGLKTSMNILTGATPPSGALAGLVSASNSVISGVTKLAFNRSRSSQSSSTSAAEKPVTHDGHRLSSIFLLTDGCPNVNPPRGHIPMLKRYLESHPPEKVGFTINTFGFGYSLDSPLLNEIAKIGNGHFGFIPDSGMVGTVFVHAVANTYATYAEGLFVDIEVDDEEVAKEMVVAGSFEAAKSSWGVQIPLGTLQYGQTKDLIVKLQRSLSKAPLTVTARCRPWDSTDQVKATRVISDSYLPPTGSATDPTLLYQNYRLSFVSEASSLFPRSAKEEDPYQHSGRGAKVPDGAAARFTELVTSVRATFPEGKSAVDSSSPASDALDLVADIEGQVLLGVKDDASFGRWGRHYLLSLSRSHQRQQCGNFKDPGLLVYGKASPLFIASRDEIDKAFDDLPPPTPRQVPMPTHRGGMGVPIAGALRSGRSSLLIAPSASKSMSLYNRSAAPCFGGGSIIELADGSKMTVDSLRIGTTVKTPRESAKVLGIVKTVIEGGALDLCELGNGLLITPWHPICLDALQGWAFPADLVTPRLTSCDAVFSLVLDTNDDPDAHAVYVGGVRCVTLGHGVVNGDIRAHPFLASHEDVLQQLLQAPGEGSVKEASGIRRDEETGLMCGFVWVDSAAMDSNRWNNMESAVKSADLVAVSM